MGWKEGLEWTTRGAYGARWTFQSDVTWKNQHLYTEFLNIAKIWTNLAPVLRIWRKKYLSGESGGERKNILALNL